MKNILLIWDIDGTLINSRGCGRRAMEKAFHYLYGIENGFADVNMAGRLDALIVKDAMINHSIDVENLNDFFEVYCKMLEYERQSGDFTELLPGIKTILSRQHPGIQFTHALGTGNIEPGARIKLEPHDINCFFPIGGFGDEAMERWEIIQKAIEKTELMYGHSFDKKDTYVIGDTPFDIGCGKKLQVKSIAIGTGPYSVETLKSYAPDYVFENLENVEKFFEIFR
ncbi:MAG: HAD family hydrolase [Bacillota bacterium]